MKFNFSINKLMRYCLLVLFLGYYGGITLFHHQHIIEGVSIVHSHPFKSCSGSSPVEHRHSKSGFALLQFISDFIAVISLIFFGVSIIRKIANNIFLISDENVPVSFPHYCNNLLRAPPIKLHI
jgi:hypothetical protein